MKTKSKRGFSLIELLVVIAIIGILTGVVVASMSGSKGKARDAKRISDIAQIQLALEQYFNRCRVYPSALDSVNSGDCSAITGILLSNFITTIPKDPSTMQDYNYYVDTTPNAIRTDYVLRAKLETNNSAMSDSMTNTSRPSWLNTANNCGATNVSGTPVEYYYCVGPK